MQIENELVGRWRHNPLGGLPELGSVAAEALRQLDLILAVRRQDADPFTWPVFPKERELVADLQQRYPADIETLLEALDLLRQLADHATVDEVALGAVKALQWTALIAGALEATDVR
jgi:hypothetical protein